MYLPLMAVVVLAVSFVKWLSDRITTTSFARWARMATLSGLWVAAAVPLAAGTVSRNREYSSALRLAQTVIDRWPTGSARRVLAMELLKVGRRDEAYAYLREAIRDDPRSHYALGVMLFQDGRQAEAREQMEQFVQQEPHLLEAVDARVLMGRALIAEGRLDAAAEQSRWRPRCSRRPGRHLGLGEVRLRNDGLMPRWPSIEFEGGPGNAASG
jgi:tetratricopeptide (TPR) repeat protein